MALKHSQAVRVLVKLNGAHPRREATNPLPAAHVGRPGLVKQNKCLSAGSHFACKLQPTQMPKHLEVGEMRLLKESFGPNGYGFVVSFVACYCYCVRNGEEDLHAEIQPFQK